MSIGALALALASATSIVIGIPTVYAFNSLLSFFDFRKGILDLLKVFSDGCKVCLQVIRIRKTT
jgi:putative flippase GtrA